MGSYTAPNNKNNPVQVAHSSSGQTRRRVIRSLVTSAGALPVIAAANPSVGKHFDYFGSRSVSLRNLHTHEELTLLTEERLVITAQMRERFNRFMRDHYSGDVTTMDPALIAHMFSLQRELGMRHGTFEIISAYRSPKTNAMLRAKGRRVARRSMHMSGQAIDLRLSAVPLNSLRDAALDLKAGGVGYYKSSGFLHFDTGRVRHW